jgi:2-methylcitrate dehydratase
MPCRIQITFRDGRRLGKDKQDYEGFYTRPMAWTTVVEKFERLSTPYTDGQTRRAIIDAVDNLETETVADLVHVLTQVRPSATQ